MKSIEEVEARRQAILQELRLIRSLKRGTLNEQFLKVHLQGSKEPVWRGPYYVFSRREGQKTVSQRLTSTTQLEQARKDVAEYKRFAALCKELEQWTEKLGELERSVPELESKKKRRKLPSNKTRK